MKRQYELPLLVGIEQAGKRRGEAQAAPGQASGAAKAGAASRVEVVLRMSDEDLQRLPHGCAMPGPMAAHERPLIGDTLSLGGVVWVVALVHHVWPAPDVHRVEVWLERMRGFADAKGPVQ